MPMLLALQTDDKVTLSLTILLTGLVVVFLVLIVLTEIIKLYGTLVHNATNKNKKPKPVEKAQEPAPAPVPAAPAAPAVEDGIPGEIVAAIAAAVYCTEGASVSAIKSIRRSRSAFRSAWGMAGVMENTRPF